MGGGICQREAVNDCRLLHSILNSYQSMNISDIRIVKDDVK
jgi:hypothetical protein